MVGAGVTSLNIVNKNGSLIYTQDFAGAATLSANDKIRVSSTFFGISAIAAQISPCRRTNSGAFDFLQPTGITALDADTFRLQCFHTPTGMKIFVSVLPPFRDHEDLLRQVFGLYTDYVLKNPFYELDMPIRCELFDREIRRLMSLDPSAPPSVSGSSVSAVSVLESVAGDWMGKVTGR
eukprot:gnl/TRDRNA2_/TRDRNA2_187056_c0_seq1.p1 gnl/TRDRNA2_/TRDRNA2_187056_c0~~gnl/TRDRNA2_/TRDRNA2_187056_c0_seq1.p1  ORF type:complete len:187 (-),score=26.18 gnl/TRDRNA2_/TRDRNA2_187056_c0_seq1:35-571(-)